MAAVSVLCLVDPRFVRKSLVGPPLANIVGRGDWFAIGAGWIDGSIYPVGTTASYLGQRVSVFCPQERMYQREHLIRVGYAYF